MYQVSTTQPKLERTVAVQPLLRPFRMGKLAVEKLAPATVCAVYGSSVANSRKPIEDAVLCR